MKYPAGILFLIFGLFVASTNSVMACGDQKANQEAYSPEISKKSFCSKEKADATNGQSKDSDCPCDQDQKGCHCPGCGLICHTGVALAVDISDLLQAVRLQNTSLRKQAFYFAQHMPEAVYLPIWQPPKLAV